MKITQIVHYEKGDLNGDYYDIELIKDKKVIASFGDSYHDSGMEKAAGFVEGVAWAIGEPVLLIRKDKDDR